MRETRADTALSTMFAVGLHLLLLLLLFAGLKWSHPMTPDAAAGAAVDADLVDPNALSASMQRALAATPPVTPTPPEPRPVEPLPQPVPTPTPEDAQTAPQPVAQQAIPVPDQRDQERVDRDALSAELRTREQEEKHRQEQIDLTQHEQQQQAVQKQRLAQQSLDEQIRKIREARRQASHEADLAEQKLKQIADVRQRATQSLQPTADSNASPPPGNNGVDAGLLARYRAALGDAIQRNWIRPDSVPLGQPCKLQIRQLPGGEVIDVQVLEPCPYDDLGKRSLEAAVLKAQPLPYAGYEPVFSRILDLKFQPEEH